MQAQRLAHHASKLQGADEGPATDVLVGFQGWQPHQNVRVPLKELDADQSCSHAMSSGKKKDHHYRSYRGCVRIVQTVVYG